MSDQPVSRQARVAAAVIDEYYSYIGQLEQQGEITSTKKRFEHLTQTFDAGIRPLVDQLRYLLSELRELAVPTEEVMADVMTTEYDGLGDREEWLQMAFDNRIVASARHVDVFERLLEEYAPRVGRS